MRIYIAGFFDSRKRLREQKEKLWHMGHEIVSSWLEEVSKLDEMSYDDFYRKLALKDLAEIQSADLIIVDTLDVTPRGGRECELGYALGKHQKMLAYIVGPERNVFHRLVDRRFETWEECLAHMTAFHGKNTAPVSDATGASSLKEAADRTEEKRSAVR